MNKTYKSATCRFLFCCCPVCPDLCAESEGFEPPVQLPVHRISSAAHSTTLAAFHSVVLMVQRYYFNDKPVFLANKILRLK